MHSGIVHLHSGLRWIVLILLVAAVVNALIKFLGQKDFTETDRKITLFTLISVHLQFVIGLILYIYDAIQNVKVQFGEHTMSNDVVRFFTVEHIVMMIAAVALITIGNRRIKGQAESKQKFKQTLIFWGLGLLVILIAIPWPWQAYGAGWG